MSTSAIKQSFLKRFIVFSAVSAFCLLFSYIYNRLGHGEYSLFMDWLFLFPLLAGALPNMIYFIFKLRASRFSGNLIASGTATLTIWSAMRGVFEIAGNSSSYSIVFFIVGSAFLAVGILMMLVTTSKR